MLHIHLNFPSVCVMCSLLFGGGVICAMYVCICEYKWTPQCVYGGQRKTLGVSVSPTSLETGSPGCSKLCSQGLQASRDSPISVSRLLQKHKDCRHTLSCLAYMGRENSNVVTNVHPLSHLPGLCM